MEVAANIRWHVPEGVDAEQVLRSGFAMMDGAQLRWLRVPGRDLNEMWASCEDVLFPCRSGRAIADHEISVGTGFVQRKPLPRRPWLSRCAGAWRPAIRRRMPHDAVVRWRRGIDRRAGQATGGELRSEHAHDALGRPIITRYGFLGEGGFGTSHDGENPRTAVVELAAASGIERISPPTAIRWRRPLSAPAS